MCGEGRGGVGGVEGQRIKLRERGREEGCGVKEAGLCVFYE